ncbi:hypothetical protein PTTG_10794, partial [Puccinia triticina 1-1 BBBD Race 1]
MSTSDSTYKPVPPHIELTSHPALKISGVEPLKAPGEKSNYLDWSVVLEIHFNVTGVGYIIETPPPGTAPTRRATQAQDNLAICLVISRTVETMQKACGRLSKKLTRTRCRGGRMYWLRKLTTARMTGDDVDAHIDQLQSYAKRLNAVVTPGTPLTPDDIHATSLLNSLPSDWHPCMSALMNESHISSTRIVSALRQESLRRKARIEEAQLMESAARANISNDHKSLPQQTAAPFCSFCNISGHDILACRSAAWVLSDHKQARNSDHSRLFDRYRRSGTRRGRSGPKPQAKAGKTTVVELGGDDGTDSEYSGSKDDASAHHPARAGNAVVVADQTANAVSNAHPDANLDSGCTNCMTPYKSDLTGIKPDSTPIRLANHSLVNPSHGGVTTLPLKTQISVPTLTTKMDEFAMSYIDQYS